MNYLKKKLKLNSKSKHNEDDDDYDNYVPPVPPHPSTLVNNQASGTPNSTLQSISDPTQPTLQEQTEPEISAEELLKQLKEKEFIRRQEEKEKIKEQEKEKQNREDWKFFLSLTAKVEDITIKTQSALEKLKDTSAVEEIIKKSDETEYVPEEDEVVVLPPGEWIAFSEDGQQPKLVKTESAENGSKRTSELESTKTPQQITEEELKKVAEEPIPETHHFPVLEEFSQLLDDFGFNKEPEVIPVAYQPVVFEEEDYLDDPFDTSFVDVSTVAPIAAKELILSSINITKESYTNGETDDEPDPFDTSYVDSAISGQSVVKPNSIDISPIETPVTPQTLPDYSHRISRCSSRDSIMSNPFLQDLTDFYTPYASGAHTPYSGTATPKRRNSTNPFEESPEEETKNGISCGQSPVASAIADMTADFYNAISANSYEPTVPSKDAEPSGQPFDPFATIHDDETPKRQSLNEDNVASVATNKVLSPEASDPFAGQPIDSLQSPVLPPPDNAYLKTNEDNNEYLSDLSDVEDNVAEASNQNNSNPVNSSTRRRSSAFQMELLSGDKDEPAPTFEPLPATTILQRKASLPPPELPEDSLIEITDSYQKEPYFDPFQTVFDKDPDEGDDHLFQIETKNEPRRQSIPDSNHRRLSTQDSLADVGQPNKDAVGIVNDAFDENINEEPAAQADEYGLAAEADISAVDESTGTGSERSDATNALHSGSVTHTTTGAETVANTMTFATSDSGVAVASNLDDLTDCGKDPFDTSDFDSAAFDAFATKFDSTAGTADNSTSYDPFASPMKSIPKSKDVSESDDIFDIFDPYTRPSTKTPKNTPMKMTRTEQERDSFDDDEQDNLRIVIRAKMKDSSGSDVVPTLAPPPLLPPPPKSPKSPALEGMDLMPDEDANQVDEFEAFFGGGQLSEAAQHVMPAGGEEEWPTAFGAAATKRTDSCESPQTPLYDEDTSEPLEEFPPKYTGDGWEMLLRYPNKKKLTANRCWKKIYVRFVSDPCVFQLFNKKEDNNPFQETPLQASYSLSDISAQQYDQYGKIFTIKLQYIFYRERVGVRPGQIAKVMQGQITSMGQFAKLGMPLEHAPQISELFKLGSLNYNDLKEMQLVVEEALFRTTIHRDRALTYKTEEIQCCVQDELYVEQNKMGIITKQLARVRIFFLAFINGMPTIEVGINDLKRQGKEVVGRHDIIPVVTEEWIRLEAEEFHCTVSPDDYEMTRIIKLIPPDACHFELMRFRIRPPRNRELPLQVSAFLNMSKSKVELKCDVLVPGCISRKHGNIPCEDISIRFHIPECWIYFFRVEKHFRYGALKSVNRRAGKVKGIERLLGSAQNPEPQMIEVTAGQAKYEHAFHSIVWRIPRLPKEGQGAYTQQFMTVRLPLTTFDQIPESFYEYVHVEFKMPSTTISHTTLRSISVTNENPPEKFVRYLAKYEYKIELNISYNEDKEPDFASAAQGTDGRKMSITSTDTERSAPMDTEAKDGANDVSNDDSD